MLYVHSGGGNWQTAKTDFVSQANRQFQFYSKWKPLRDTNFECSQDILYTVTFTFLLLHSKTYMYYFFRCFGLIYLSFSPFPPFFRKCLKLQFSGVFVEKCIKTQSMSKMKHIILHRIPVRTEHDKEFKDFLWLFVWSLLLFFFVYTISNLICIIYNHVVHYPCTIYQQYTQNIVKRAGGTTSSTVIQKQFIDILITLARHFGN